MIKKAALILFTFSALVGAHLLYTAGFALVVEQMAAASTDQDPLPELELDSALTSRQLALELFGKDHFTSKPIKLTYYDKSRGSYMYAEDHEFSDDGKVMTITPFAMISVSKDGASHKTVTSDKAIIRFNVPFALLRKNSEPQRVIHAELVGNVRIRDDKGSKNPADDLQIGPMTHVEYEEKTMQITTDSDVVIQDQDMIITGTQLMLQLKRKAPVLPGAPPAAGGSGAGTFDAETAFLYKNIHIVIKDVTPGGILPGKSETNEQGQTPLDLRCAGQMRIDLPQARHKVVIGPPDLNREPEPTLCRFEKNVCVIRGNTNPDQLNCDMLFLTLRPDPKPEAPPVPAQPDPATTTAAVDPAAPPQPEAGGGGRLTALKIRTALAQGHAVWLQSESQGLKALCVELKYEKRQDPSAPDVTYLNGGTHKKIHVEKVDTETEGPQAGSIKSVMKLVAADMTILDFGNGESQITARGPGKSEDSPSRTAAVRRTAWFEEQMMLQTTRDKIAPAAAADSPLAATSSAASAPVGPLRRWVTLTGQPKLQDVESSSTLDAQDRIVAEFESAPKADPTAKGDGPARIKWLKGYNNVHLTTPGRTLTAWKTFQAIFVDPEPVPGAAPTALAANAAPATAGPVLAQATDDAPLPEATPDAPPPPVEGAVDARANHVHAWINQAQGKTKGDLREAKLRGGVMVHQDAAPGERWPKNMAGEALDLFTQGKGLMKFNASATDPEASITDGKTRLATSDESRDGARLRLISRADSAPPAGMARIEIDNKVIESEKIVGMDQLANHAWAIGHGSMTQLADAGLLDDKGLMADKPKKPGAPNPGAREKLVITWNDRMDFFGKDVDRAGREAAKIEFRGTSETVRTADGRETFRRGVQALKADAGITCDTMDVYLDKIVDFSKSAKTPAGSKAPGETPDAKPAPGTDAEIAFIECHGVDGLDNKDRAYAGVDLTSQKYFDGTKILQDKYRIQHNHLAYDKRTGDFEGAGPGTAFIYKGKLPDPKVLQVKAATAKPGDAEIHTMQLTKVQFTDLMKGRMGVTRSGADPGERIVEFTGNVQTANAVVLDGYRDLLFDQLDRKPDSLFLTSDALRVRSEFHLVNQKKVDHQLIYAQGNVTAKTVTRLIQGDRLTYDSATELIYVYGDDGKEVSLTEQSAPGQPPNRNYGTAVRYNKRTGEGGITDPQKIQLFDLKTGIRPKAGFPDLGGAGAKPDPKKQQRLKFQKPSKTATERKGFTGGQ